MTTYDIFIFLQEIVVWKYLFNETKRLTFPSTSYQPAVLYLTCTRKLFVFPYLTYFSILPMFWQLSATVNISTV